MADFSFISDPGNLSVSFTNLSTNAQNYVWDFGNGENSLEMNPTHVYLTADSFLVSLIALGACGTDTSTRMVETNCGPTISDFSFASDPANLSISFSNLSLNGSSFSWNFGDGTVSSQLNPTHIYPSPDSFQVALIAFGPCEVDTSYQMVEAACEPSMADFSFQLDTSNLKVQFTNLSQNVNQVEWFFGDGTGDVMPNPVHQYPYSDTFLVTLLAYGPCEIDTISKQVIPQCTGTKAAFSYSTDSLGLTVSFANFSLNADTYSWSLGDGTGSSEMNPVHQYDTPDNYEVIMVAYGACEIDTARAIIRPDCNVPGASLSAILDPSSLQATLTASLQGADAYVWHFDGGIGDSSLLNPTVSFPQSGLYTISLSVSNACGSATYCTQFYLPQLVLSSDPIAPLTFQWRVFPNPATERWWLEALSDISEEMEVHLLDLRGRILFRQNYRMNHQKVLEIPAAGLAAGRYWLRIMNEKGIQTIALQKG